MVGVAIHWIRDKVEEGVFASTSHAFEYSIRQLMKKEKRRGTSQTPILKKLLLLRNS